MASYEHAYELVRVHGEARWNARLVPLTVDGLIYASSMVLLDSARRKVPVPAPARWLLGLGIGATPAALRRCALSKHGLSFAPGCYRCSGRVGPTGARRACRRMGGLSDRGGVSIGDPSPRQAADRLPRS